MKVRLVHPLARTLALPLALCVALTLAPAPAPAQLASNTANWGMTFGLEFVTANYDPSGSDHDRGTAPYAYASRGWGLDGNLGLVFLRHFMFGGDVGAVLFSGNRTFSDASGQSSFTAMTTNSLTGSMYVGLVSSPLGTSAKLGRKWWLGAKFGSAKWGGERDLEGCVGCGKNPLPMVSGAYLEPFVVFGGGDRDGGGGFRLAYRKSIFAAETIRSSVSLGFFFDFLKL